MPENDSLPPALAPNESGAMEDSTAHSACVSNPVEIGPAQIAPVSLVIDEENVQGQGTAGQLKSPKQKVKQEDTRQPDRAFKTAQPPKVSPLPEVPKTESNQQTWKDKYDSLLDEAVKQYRAQKEEIKLAKQQLEAQKKLPLVQKKDNYCWSFGDQVLNHEFCWLYHEMNYELSCACRNLDPMITPDTILRFSQNPEYWEITSLCREPWVEKILKESDPASNMPLFVLQRMVLSYILRWVFKPILVGLDKEAETHLLRLEDSMRSRMTPSVVDRWMAETLRNYTALPSYSTDRDNFLRSHTNFLLKFLDHFALNKDALPQAEYWKERREGFHEEVMERAGELASKMSFSFTKLSIGWDYCEKTELLKRELGCIDVQLPSRAPLNRMSFHKFGEDDKIADIVMFLRPPIYELSRTTDRRMIGKARIIAKPVPGYDPNPPRDPKQVRKEEFTKELAAWLLPKEYEIPIEGRALITQ